MDRVKEIFEAILTGELKPFEVANELRIYNKPLPPEFEVIVTPALIIKRLEAYLHDNIDADELSEWASFIVTMDGFATPYWNDNSDEADKFDSMWDILQRLSTPNLDGQIEKENVEKYVTILKKLPLID